MSTTANGSKLPLGDLPSEQVPCLEGKDCRTFCGSTGYSQSKEGRPCTWPERGQRPGRVGSQRSGGKAKKKKSIEKLKEIRHEVGECCGNETMESKQNTDPLRTLLRFF